MAEVKLTLSRKNPGALIDIGALILEKQAPAAPPGGGAPPAPLVPGLESETTELKAAHEALKAAKLAYEKAEADLNGLRETRNQKADTSRTLLSNYVQLVSGKVKGDEAKLRALGLELVQDSVRSSEPPGRVVNLQLTQADLDGALDGQHDVPDRAASYDVQLTTVDPTNGPYQTVLQTTQSAWQLKGLTSGNRVWVRVRAIGTNGVGAWSDPATKIVP